MRTQDHPRSQILLPEVVKMSTEVSRKFTHTIDYQETDAIELASVGIPEGEYDFLLLGKDILILKDHVEVGRMDLSELIRRRRENLLDESRVYPGAGKEDFVVQRVIAECGIGTSLEEIVLQ